MPTSDDPSFAALFESSAAARTGDRRFHAGERVEVVVVAVGREAVFADLGGKQEGMFERVELSDAEGALQVEVGSRIQAVVKNVDFATGQVRLSPVAVRRAPEEAPVALAAASGGANLTEGARVKGKVTGVERYGVFVQIAGTQGRSGRGLVPTKESATPRGADLKKHFTVGQDIEAKIVHIEAETGRIRMSISALAGDDERRDYEAFKAHGGEAGGSADAAGSTSTEAGAAKPARAKGGKRAAPEPRGFGTLGDLLGKTGATKPGVAEKPAAAEPAARTIVRRSPSARKKP